MIYTYSIHLYIVFYFTVFIIIMMGISVVSYNCQAFKSSTEFIAKMCDTAQVIALQETWLIPAELHLPSQLNNAFEGYSISSVDMSNGLLSGRPFGGLSFLWSKDLSKYINVLQYDDDRILGILLKLPNKSILFLNVYMPSSAHDETDLYNYYLGKLSSIIAECQEENICILGDLNASPGTGRYNDLISMSHEYDMIISDVSRLPPDTYTHINHASLSRSWLDHFLVTTVLDDSITNVTVCNDFSTSDHCPIQIDINIDQLPSVELVLEDTPRIRWDFANQIKRERFFELLDSELREIDIDDVSVCPLIGCHRRDHRTCITVIYSKFTQAVCRVGSLVFGLMRPGLKPVPGWNDYVRDHYSAYRENFASWRDAGSPREGQIAYDMRRARGRFRLALRQCRSQEAELRAQALSNKLVNGYCKQFWNDVNSMNPRPISLAQCIEGITGKQEIAEMWRNEYRALFNCIEGSKLTGVLCADSDAEPVTAEEIALLSSSLSTGKAVGRDGIPGEVMKFGSYVLYLWLSKFISQCFNMKYLPDLVMLVLLNPILKSKTGDHSLKSNYRPIAITSSISKLVELIIKERIITYLDTSDSQFGFKAKHGTDMAIYTLKMTLQYYMNCNSPVFVCFLDASKAFDRVNHVKLFQILLQRGLPTYLISILSYWYQAQQYAVRWGNVVSSYFLVSNGIRQGGILSPLLLTHRTLSPYW